MNEFGSLAVKKIVMMKSNKYVFFKKPFCKFRWDSNSFCRNKIPYYQLARVAGPHLMAGNTLMVKHAGCVPQCAIEFEKLWMDAGAPEGLYTNLK
jgi:hypothetical protein